MIFCYGRPSRLIYWGKKTYFSDSKFLYTPYQIQSYHNYSVSSPTSPHLAFFCPSQIWFFSIPWLPLSFAHGGSLLKNTTCQPHSPPLQPSQLKSPSSPERSFEHPPNWFPWFYPSVYPQSIPSTIATVILLKHVQLSLLNTFCWISISLRGEDKFLNGLHSLPRLSPIAFLT